MSAVSKWILSIFAVIIIGVTVDLLFSGSRIPRNCFPFWAKMISLVFPLTYCINIIRFVLNIGGKEKQWILNIAGLLVCMCIMVAVTVVLTYQVERHNRETGELQLY